MHDPDFWTNCAGAMELSIEGERLIARDITDALRDMSRPPIRAFRGLCRRPTRPGHQPN